MNTHHNLRANSARLTDRFMTAIFYLVGGFFLALLIVFAGYILINGALNFKPEFLAFDSNGIGNQLFNTIYLVFLSLLVSVPLGVATGIYMAEYAGNGKAVHYVRICIQSLSSLPSIVVGLFGYMLFIQMTGMSWNLFAGAMTVSILSVPLLTTTTEDALRNLPPEYKAGSMGLGATHWQTIIKVLLPACVTRIVTGIILAAGRGFGEAAALLYTAGMSTSINWERWSDLSSNKSPFNPFRTGETLALHIWKLRTEGGLNPDADAIAAVTSALLVLLVLSFSLLARYLSARIDRKTTGGK